MKDLDTHPLAEQLSSLMGGDEGLHLQPTQELRIGYGAIYRVALPGRSSTPVVVKWFSRTE